MNFFRKKSFISDKVQYEFDKHKYNKAVLRIDDKLAVAYNLSVQGSSGIARANLPLVSATNAQPYFEVYIFHGGKDGSSETPASIVVGLVTADHPVDQPPGWHRGSYGYCGEDGKKYSGLSAGIGFTYGPTFSTGDVVGVGFDNMSNTIFFTKNGQFLGVAFEHVIHGEQLYPCVALTSPLESVIINFIPPFIYSRSQFQGHSAEEGISEDPQIVWDTNRCAKSIEIRQRTATVTPEGGWNVTGVVQCNRPFAFTHGEPFCYFEVTIDQLEKGHVAIGLANKEYPLNKHVGWLKRSYGYHSDDGRRFKWKEHDSISNDGDPYGPSYTQGDVVGCGLNLLTREIFFTKNSEYLGIAFTNVYGVLYPSVSITGPIVTFTSSFSPPYKYNPNQNEHAFNHPYINPHAEGSSSSADNSPKRLSSSGGTNTPPTSVQSMHRSPSGNMVGNRPASLSNPPLPSFKPALFPPKSQSVNNISPRNPGALGNSRNSTSIPLGMPMVHSHSASSVASSIDTSSPRDSPRPDDPMNPSAWKKWSKSLKVKDDIILSLIKRKTSAALGNRQLNNTNRLCYFEVIIEAHEKGGTFSVGLACDDYPLNRAIGREPKSFGYTDEGKKWKGELVGENYGPMYGSNDVIGCGINTVTREIFFTKNGTYLGVAFWDVPTVPLYPAVALKSPVGLGCVATFVPPFKFNFQNLPGVSPSIWSESLGEGMWRRGFNAWPTSDVSIWLQCIGYGQYSKRFYENNISGRHISTFTHALLKNELGIDSYGHRDDILDKAKRLAAAWRDRGFDDDPGSSSDDLSESDFGATGGIAGARWRRSLRGTPWDRTSDLSEGYSTDGISPSAAHHSRLSASIQGLSVNNSLLQHSSYSPRNSSQDDSSATSTSSSASNSTTTSTTILKGSGGHHEYEIPYEELEHGDVVGKGFFGEVKRGVWRETDVAIKVIYRDSFKSKSSLDMFQNEVSILSKLRHPNIVQFMGASTTAGNHCIVMEWMDAGSLRQFLIDYSWSFNKHPYLRLKIVLDIARGMNYLHGWTPPILHRDLSSRNILMDSVDNAGGSFRGIKSKVSDFGLSRLKLEQEGTMTASVGCIPYMAPEVYKGEANSEKSDVYSYAMIVWEVLTGEEPQQDMKPLKMAHLAAHAGYRPPMPPAITPQWKQLLLVGWNEDPTLRPTFRQIIGMLKSMEEAGESAYAVDITAVPAESIPQAPVDIGVYDE